MTIYTANENTTIGLFSTLNKKAKSLFTITETEAIDATDSLIIACLKKMTYNDSLRNESINMSDSLALMEENYVLRNYILQGVINNNARTHDIDSLNNYYADSLVDENSTISTSEQIEENLLDVNDIYYSTLAKGIYEFDSLQTITLYNIGIQCPKEGGKAVPVAQGIYHYINDTIVFANDTNCTEESPRLAKYNKSGKYDSYIYPNPSSQSATLRFNLPDKQNGFFIIYDFLARELKQFALLAETHEFEFKGQELNQGIYSYLIVTEGAIISRGKFSILK